MCKIATRSQPTSSMGRLPAACQLQVHVASFTHQTECPHTCTVPLSRAFMDHLLRQPCRPHLSVRVKDYGCSSFEGKHPSVGYPLHNPTRVSVSTSLRRHRPHPVRQEQIRMKTGRISAVQAVHQQQDVAPHEEMLPPPDEPLKPKAGAVVVGGGPAGVAAALALAKIRGWSDVTLVERLPDLTWFDPDRSYMYGINPRGQGAIAMLGLEEAMKEIGCPQVGLSFTTVEASGKVTRLERPTVGQKVVSYLMPRQDLMKILAQGLAHHNESAGTFGTQVRVLTSSRVVWMERVRGKDGEGERLGVVIRKGKRGERGEEGEEDIVLYPSLVLGCDGINSTVRRTLQAWSSQGHVAATGSGHVEHSFALREYPSPAAGLRFKVLRLPATLQLRDGTVIDNLTGVAFIGSFKGEWMRISCFLIKDPDGERAGTIVLRPDHPFWKIPPGDAAACRAMFEEAFPQIDINSMVPDDVMERFATSEGGVFPVPCASDGLSSVIGPQRDQEHAQARQGEALVTSAVVLVGDAAHSFPPDLGQGVNAALQDVQALVTHLARSNDDVAGAAVAYQADRGPEAHAVSQLMSVGFPYFYNQAPLRGMIFQAQFMARVVLSKALGEKVMPPPAVVLMTDYNRSFSECWRLNEEGNKKIAAGLAVLSLVVLGFMVL